MRKKAPVTITLSGAEALTYAAFRDAARNLLREAQRAKETGAALNVSHERFRECLQAMTSVIAPPNAG